MYIPINVGTRRESQCTFIQIWKTINEIPTVGYVKGQVAYNYSL